MEPISSNMAAQEERPVAPAGFVLNPLAFSVAVFVVVHVISLCIWRLFVDAKLAVWKYSPQPFGMYLFWGTLVLVFIGFNFGMAGFSAFRQPVWGCITTVATVALAFLCRIFLLMVMAHWTLHLLQWAVLGTVRPALSC
ncbi:hypothetical protein [Paraburkholderia caribensis]|uniref:hypothetical protein n=1 Tax=Paraburkholderia caribensis TaxID=75105 RepID=UPI001F1F1ABB|nr:hypothetical protein [Paraburkholderia caribensis]